MKIISKLATPLERRDENPNIELAVEISAEENREAVAELFALLTGKNKNFQSDAIKVIYETAERNPALVSPYISQLVAALKSKNNRIQWGAMTALDAVAAHKSNEVFKFLPKILLAADSGSVITNDHCVGLLVKLCRIPKYASDAFSLLNERLLMAPSNQFPMYAENALAVITEANRDVFIRTLLSRKETLEKDSGKKRIDKVLKKISSK